MALGNPRQIFGVHSVTPYSRTTGAPYGYVRVVKDSSISLSGELIKNTGGSNKYPYAVEDGAITAEMTLKFAEYPNFVFELFLGKAVTPISAEASGDVSTPVEVVGTSLIDASTGIATITKKSGQNATLKFARYLIKAVSSTTVDVYALSDVDSTRGTDWEFQNDALKITASPLTVTQSAATEIPGTGLEITGGSGTIALVTDDAATFTTRPISTVGGMSVRIGASTDQAPEFGCLIVAQKRASDELFEIDAFRCKASGLPIGFAEKAFSELEAKAELLYDSAKNGVFDVRTISV